MAAAVSVWVVIAAAIFLAMAFLVWPAWRRAQRARRAEAWWWRTVMAGAKQRARAAVRPDGTLGPTSARCVTQWGAVTSERPGGGAGPLHIPAPAPLVHLDGGRQKRDHAAMTHLDDLLADFNRTVQTLISLGRVERALVRIERRLGIVIQQGGDMSEAMDAVRNQVAAINTGVADVEQAVTDLANRLTNNPTEAEAAAVAAELTSLAGRFAPIKDSIGQLDPDTPGGPIDDTGGGGEVPGDEDPGDMGDETGGGGTPA